ncbi:MAG: hypothetical protein IPM79_17305 [Polyangiaceae bacterium]|nr:hypothetical protein [Polyangiaceae bacterium]MBK8939325.1 hypothetical protein [Polyangiaceae bacterium]
MKAWLKLTALAALGALGLSLWTLSARSQAKPPASSELELAGSAVVSESAALSATAASKPASQPKRRYSVAAIGDSLTDPKAGGGQYLTYLADHCKQSRFDSYGKGGNMVSQMRRRFARDVLGEGGAKRPAYTHLIVLGGIADIGSSETANRTLDKIKDDLGAMYQLASDAGMQVIALTIPPWGAWPTYNDDRHAMMLAMNSWIRKPPKHVAQVTDVFPALVCDGRKLCSKYASDKIHWNKQGHEVVGAMLLSEVFADCE